MEICSLHPVDLDLVRRYVEVVQGVAHAASLGVSDPVWATRLVATARQGYAEALAGQEQGAAALGYGLAQLLATAAPSFVQPGLGWTMLEARFDRGIGMFLRPPSRLLIDAGLGADAARSLPIRLDPSRGMMAGAFVPARLVPELTDVIERRAGRLARRLIEAQRDPVPALGLLLEACAEASRRGVGLLEALDVIVPDAPAASPPGAQPVWPNVKRLDPTLRRRLELAARPPKPPGLMARLLGRS